MSTLALPSTTVSYRTDNVSSAALAFYLCAGVLLLFLATSEDTRHWFVIPVLLCGVLIASDTVDWVRGRLNLFDPVGIVGILGIYFFFLAPPLHVSWYYW